MEVIAFANQKGGGLKTKTTSVHNIATVKAIAGKKVLMINLFSRALKRL